MPNSNNCGKKRTACTLADTLIEMDFSAVSDLFVQNEAGAPSVLWNPSTFDISHPVIKSFAEIMLAGASESELLREGEFSELKPHFFEPWIMVLKPEPDGSDFRYLKYGSEIAAMFGRDLTGRCTSEIGGHISEFFVALYKAVAVRKQSVLSVHVPPPGVFATFWRRLIFPLINETGQVRTIAAVNVPDNDLQAGLEALPDPACVTNEEGLLMYANTSARLLFGEPTLPRDHISKFCEIDIQLPADAAGFAKAETSITSRTVGARDQILLHIELRTSATIFRGIPYFVVQLKPY